jgi:hypothetical protein
MQTAYEGILAGLVLKLEGFDEEVYISNANRLGTCEHVSAYSRTLGIEVAILNHEHNGIKILVSRPTDSTRHDGVISTPGSTNLFSSYIRELDPLTIRCVVLEALKELKLIPSEVTP